MNIEDIKLAIWDLDETFWKGTLSDGPVTIPDDHINLIKNMVDAGIMCSICSKNEITSVREQLKLAGIEEYFVFISINWTPKGNRVKQIVNEMGLREVNVLFIDDNPSNRGEVKQACPQMDVEDIDIIPLLINFFSSAEKKDLGHTRLKQYVLLEKKRDFKATIASNEDFLFQSNIHVGIHKDCIEHIDRISDLVLRSNQLNFTKVRSTKEEIRRLISNPKFECGYVTVNDAFGDYGIVGFYAIKDGRLVHFVFSCRTLNMGVEQYVYKYLNYPTVDIIGEVASDLQTPNPVWINVNDNRNDLNHNSTVAQIAKHMVLKGPCDIRQIFGYIKDDAYIIEEFTYVNDRGILVEGRNHTSHIIQYDQVSKEDIERLSEELPFADPQMYATKAFDQDTEVLIISLFTDPNLGIYREKNSGIEVAFGEWINDLTDERRWDEYTENNGDVFLANWKPTLKELKRIKEKFDYLGRYQPNQVMQNVDRIYHLLHEGQKLFLCLGSEMPYLKNTQKAYADRHEYNKELNQLVREWASKKNDVVLLDFNKYVHGQQDFINNINHFTRIVYYRMAQDIIGNLQLYQRDLKRKSFFAMEVKRVVKNVLRPIYHRIMGQ